MKLALSIGLFLLASSTIIGVCFFGLPETFGSLSLVGQKELTAGTYFADRTTPSEIRRDYVGTDGGAGKIRILIVPGHDDQYGGTEFKGLTEAKLNLDISERIAALFGADSRFSVAMTRDSHGYTADFLEYLKENGSSIAEFVANSKNVMANAMHKGLVEEYTAGVIHNSVVPEVGRRLYGINKYANDNKFQLIIAVHFNDYGGRKKSAAGVYSGFTVYVPEKQFSNAKSSRAIAEYVSGELSKYFAISNLPLERAGVVDDQELIAIGANNTLEAASMLVEYGYIYESFIQDKVTRNLALDLMAEKTYTGVKKFFDGNFGSDNFFDVSLLPYRFSENLKTGMTGKKDIFALQVALSHDGFYPPAGKSRNECPLSPKFAGCSVAAVLEFQNAYGIQNEKGFVGVQTRAKLNELYALKNTTLVRVTEPKEEASAGTKLLH